MSEMMKKLSSKAAVEAPFPVGAQVFITRAGFPRPVGTMVTVDAAYNLGTKKKPVWRIEAFGMWFYEEDISLTNPCA